MLAFWKSRKTIISANGAKHFPCRSALGGPFGQFRNFQCKSRKNGFFGGLENLNCRKGDFWRKTRAFIILATLTNALVVRFEVNGVCPEDFSMRRNCRKFMSLVIDLNRYFELVNLNFYEK